MKNIIKVTILYFGIFHFFVGCSVPKFYNEIKTLKDKGRIEINNETNALNKVTIQECDFNKLVLKKIKNELKNTNQIIYFYSSESSIYLSKIWVIVFDVDHKVYYQLETNNSNPKQIDLVGKTEFLSDSYSSFIFENFINNNCEKLKNKGKDKISGVRTFEEVYYVNLKTKVSYNCFFKNFILLE